jgi:hypothetical protein
MRTIDPSIMANKDAKAYYVTIPLFLIPRLP